MAIGLPLESWAAANQRNLPIMRPWDSLRIKKE